MDTQSLSGLRVIEHCGWNGAFAGRLLADAGADVVRVVGPGGDPLEHEPPFFNGTDTSIQASWYNLGKRIVRADPATEAGRDALCTLLGGADVLIEDWLPGTEPLTAAALQAANPRLVRLSMTPFGRTGPWAGYRASDIVANALGGEAWLTGTSDTPPINGYGNQTVHTVGIYGAILALAGVRVARESGAPQHIDLSAHEALITCTEQMLMQWFFPKGTWKTPIARRQGSLHWTRVYEVVPDRNGTGLMITAAQRLQDEILPWMEATGGIGDLGDKERYPDVIAIIRNSGHLMQVMADWIAQNDADEIFAEAQRRRLAWGPVRDVPTALESPQIPARKYFTERKVPGGATIPFPGQLYNVDIERPALPLPATVPIPDVGWEARTPQAAEAGGATPQQPLKGVRILDFTHVLAGPFGTRVLADLGADVLKVGTGSRSGAANNPSHPYYAMWNRNKKSIQIDMSTEEGRALCRRLAEQSDVVTENFRAGVLRRWGMDRASLRERNPGLTVVSMSGMGPDGPWSEFSTYAPTLHALTGLTYLTNPPGEHLQGYGFSLADHLSGLAAALAALEGMEHRRRTGQGLDVDLAQYQIALHLLAPTYLDYSSNGRSPEPVGNRDPFDARAPQGIYPCHGEDAWVAISVQGDAQWRALCAVLGQDALADDARFATHDGRVQHHDELDRIIAAWTQERDRYAVMDACQEAGVPAGAVQNAEDIATRDAQSLAHDFLTTAESPVIGEYGMERFPALFNGAPVPHYEGVHDLGADTFQVLSDLLGMDSDEIADLTARGVLS